MVRQIDLTTYQINLHTSFLDNQLSYLTPTLMTNIWVTYLSYPNTTCLFDASSIPLDGNKG